MRKRGRLVGKSNLTIHRLSLGTGYREVKTEVVDEEGERMLRTLESHGSLLLFSRHFVSTWGQASS